MDFREIILDTETTGLDPRSGHRIVEIGAVEIVDKVRTGREFHCYINPQRDMPIEAYRVHGLSSNFLKDKPLFKDIANDFAEFISGGKLVIHNAPFDIKFLNHELSLLNLPSIELTEVIDTLIMAKKAFPGSRVNLDALCNRFKINNTSRDLHGALIDARLLTEVYIELLGGRQVSLNLGDKKSQTSVVDVKSKYQAQGNKIVISPTKQETEQHDIFLKKIKLSN